jgi:hypothetical protein
MAWLNANAPAIQAIAMVVSVVVTGVLVVITARYVGLTNHLVTNARETLAFMRAERTATIERQRTTLVGLIDHIWSSQDLVDKR